MRTVLFATVFLAIIIMCAGAAAVASPTPVSPEEAQAWIRYLVPLPKFIDISYKTEVDTASIAIYPPGGSDVVVGQACKELRVTLGLAENAPNPPSPAFTITLVLGGPEADSLATLNNSEQASKVVIEPGNNGLRLIALQPRGLYYAVKSLQQLIAPYVVGTTARMPLFEMQDWPDMMDRGLWGCDHFVWLRWMADRKMNIGEQISARSVTSDRVGHSSLKDGREPMVTEGPYYGLAPVPVTLHLEQVSGSGLFTYYPEVIGVGGQYGCICYSNGAFTHVLADWICDLASLPFVEGVDVWMAENLHGSGGCHCTQCSLVNRNVLEAQTIVAAWNEAKTRLGRPDLKLWILTSEETYSSNSAVFAAIPSDVRVWYYESLRTYNNGKISIISNAVANLAASGRYAGVCPSLCNVGNTQPFQSADFINYRMTDFVNKGLSGLLGYATPPPLVDFVGYNVEAAAEWSWNSTGRSLHEFAASYAVRKGYSEPETFAQWADLIGKVEFDLYGSEWPSCEGKFWPGYVADLLQDGNLPNLGSGSDTARGPWAEFKSAQQLDDDCARAQQALALAKRMGNDEYYYETVYCDGLVTALRALYKLKSLVVNGTVSSGNRETARYYFGVYIVSIQQAIDAVQNWCMEVNDESGSVGGIVGKLQGCIYGDGGANPGMLAVANSCNCTPTLIYTGEPATSIVEAKNRGAGAMVKLYGSLVSGGYSNSYCIQERNRSAGIKVRTTSAVTTSAPVCVSGYVENVNGELGIYSDLVQSAGSVESVKPLGMSLRNLGGGAFGAQAAPKEYRMVNQGGTPVETLLPCQGLNTMGLYVRVAGLVTAVASGYIYIDDGSGCDDGSGIPGVRVVYANSAWGKPAAGEYVTVNGMSSSYYERGSTWRALYLAKSTDVVINPVPAEIILDENDAALAGTWTYATAADAYQGDYDHTATAATESATARWTPNFSRAGAYDVYVMYSAGADRPAAATYTVAYDGGTQTYAVNQTTGGGAWQLLGRKSFVVGTAGYVQLTNASAVTGKTVVADAVRFVRASGGTPPSIATQPANRNVCSGSSATFGVVATGSDPIGYQWRKGTANITDGGHYSGAATAVLTVSTCDSSDASSNLNCVVSNLYGTVVSSNVSLTVADPSALPSALAATGVGAQTITWNWNAVTGATSYRLWTAASGGTQIGGSLSTNSYAESDLNPGTSYTRYVEAITPCGTTSPRVQLGPTSTTARWCIQNGGFESGFTNGVGNYWTKGTDDGTHTYAQDTSIKHGGTSSQKLVDPMGAEAFTAWVYQKINVQPGRNYTYGAWNLRQTANGCVVKLGVNQTGGLTPDFTTETMGGGSTGWVLKSTNLTAGATGVVTVMFCAGYNKNTTAYIDDVFVLPQAPSSSGGAATISQGGSATITASGGFGGVSSELHWYTGANGTGTHVGTGTSLVVSPTATTTYYPRWEPAGSSCPSTDGPSVTVTVI